MHLLMSSAIVILWMSHLCSGFLTDNNQTAVEGQDVRLACNRRQYVHQPVDWKYKQAPAISEFYICMNGSVLPRFGHRFSLDGIDYTLTILNATINDTGLYFCTEDSGLGENHFVYLQVVREERNELEPTSPSDSESGPSSAAAIVTPILIITCLIFVIVAVVFVRRRKGLICPSDTTMRKTVTDVYRLCRRHPQPIKHLDTESAVRGVTQLDDKIFVICYGSDTVKVFGLNYEQLEDIIVNGLKYPEDIAACGETRSLYVSDCISHGCVWRVAMDGQANKFLPTTKTSPFRSRSLSVTSGRLLVTTYDDELLLYGADGVELKRLSFADKNMSALQHAIETSRGTFVFCHRYPEPQVVETDSDGRIISVFNNQQHLTWPCYLSFDSDGKMLIVDRERHHVLLLTSDLQLDRVLLDNEHNQLANEPWRLFYVQLARLLIVTSWVSPGVVQVFALSHRDSNKVLRPPFVIPRNRLLKV